MNKLQETIAKLEANANRGELSEQLLQLLLEKERELGSDPSEEAAEQAVKQVISEHLMQALRRKRFSEDPADEDAWDADMDASMDVVRKVFDDMEIHYRGYAHQKGVQAFELGVSNRGKTLRVKVYLEASPRVCRIDAIFPFLADRVFAYPLCEKLAKENYPRRFGALQYDADDGELSYRYSFPIAHGLHEDDFRSVFMAVLASADSSYDVVRQYAVGRLRRAAREEVTCRAQELIIELDQ